MLEDASDRHLLHSGTFSCRSCLSATNCRYSSCLCRVFMYIMCFSSIASAVNMGQSFTSLMSKWPAPSLQKHPLQIHLLVDIFLLAVGRVPGKNGEQAPAKFTCGRCMWGPVVSSRRVSSVTLIGRCISPDQKRTQQSCCPWRSRRSLS